MVSRIVRRTRRKPAAVGVQRDRNPVRVGETLGRRGELCVIEPARRAPGIPLDPGKAQRIPPHGVSALIKAQWL